MSLKKISFVLLLAALFTFILLNYFLGAFTVQGDSMKPTLQSRDKLIVWKWKVNKNLKRFDLVIFYQPDQPQRMLVKRVIALPGETLQIKDNRILINGQELEENYSTNLRYEVYQDLAEVKVPPAHYFLLGDNRFISVDSRSFGFVPERYIIGRVIWRYWPLKQIGRVE